MTTHPTIDPRPLSARKVDHDTTGNPDLDEAHVAFLRDRAHFVRTETVRLISIAKTGHYASSFSAAEIFAVLYYDTLRLHFADPDNHDRDRFLLGKGHAAVGLYPLLADWGFLETAVLDEYTRLGNPLGDHPDMTRVPGVDFSSGSLGHALSTGMGMALAARQDGRDYNVFALLGDGEQHEGQIWEAAMGAAHHKLSNLVAIVDRNMYSLDGPVDDVVGLEPLAQKWESFGWDVFEVDGHDVEAVATCLRTVTARESDRPAVVIAHTVKGKGIEYMEKGFGWHLGWLDEEDEAAAYAELDSGPVKDGATLSERSWSLTDLLDQAPGFSALSEVLIELTAEGRPITVGTADLKYSNGLVRYEEAHPDRFVQFGISEQNMVSAAAGLAAAGREPYISTFASFLALLCCEQIRTDTAYTQLPVRLIGHHAGITLGFYGTSHHATEDLGIMRTIANMTVVAPADGNALASLIRDLKDHQGPAYFRVGRGRDEQVYAPGVDLVAGTAYVHRTGSDGTIIATGSMVAPSIEAARRLAAEGLDVGVLDMHTIKPLDNDAVLTALEQSPAILTVEEHSTIGGLGGAVAEVLAEATLPSRLTRHGMPDEYSLIGPPTHLYRHYGLDADGIVEQARTAFAR